MSALPLASEAYGVADASASPVSETVFISQIQAGSARSAEGQALSSGSCVIGPRSSPEVLPGQPRAAQSYVGPIPTSGEIEVGQARDVRAALTTASAAAQSSCISVVTIENATRGTINYQITWPKGEWKTFAVAAGKTLMHWTSGANIKASIRFDWSFQAGFQGRSYALPSLDFAGAKPSRSDDGALYRFEPVTNGVNLYSTRPLDKSRLAEYRSGLAYSSSFPNLMSNFEVIGKSSGLYNCIAHSLGIHDRWISPPKVGPSANLFQYADQMYAQKGYARMTSLDLSFKPGWQKVALYAKVVNGRITQFTHGALQEQGYWTSKVGSMALIRHLKPEALTGGLYGQVVAVYARRV